MIIKTEHLIIRDFQKKDAAGLLEYLSHPRVNCFVGDRLYSEESALAYIFHSSEDMLRYAVCLREDDLIIGDVFALCEYTDTYSIGWHFNKHFEGKDWRMKRQQDFWTTFSVMPTHDVFTDLSKTIICGQKDCVNVSE